MHLTGLEKKTEGVLQCHELLVRKQRPDTPVQGHCRRIHAPVLSEPLGVLTMTYHYRKDKSYLVPLLVC